GPLGLDVSRPAGAAILGVAESCCAAVAAGSAGAAAEWRGRGRGRGKRQLRWIPLRQLRPRGQTFLFYVGGSMESIPHKYDATKI
ncbi:MAG: hypothetical protein ACPIOQ_31065, partial [Promethearchaeia archaeon]